LLELGAQVSARDQDSWTPLHFAARFHGDENEIINELLEKGADVNVKDADGWTPLHNASRNGKLRTVNLLLSCKADIRIQNKIGENAVHVACRKGKVKVLEHLMDHAQKEGLLDEMLRQTDQYGRSLRHVAATQVVASIVSNYEKMGARPTRSNFRAQAEIEEKNVSSSRTHWSVLGPMIRTVAALRVKRAR